MKTKYFFLSLVCAAFLSSSMPFGNHTLQPGDEAPLFTPASGQSLPELERLKGKYVVVNFWSPSDPESRINNKRLADLTSTLPSSQIQFVSICTQSDSTLNALIMENDQVPSSIIALDSNQLSSEVFEDYQTESGCRSFLIDPFGNLKTVSPSHSEIKSVVV